MLNPDFLLSSLIIVLIPGTGVIYTVSAGLFSGWRSSVAAAFGCTLGIVPHVLASILGLSFILHQSALMFQAIKGIGVLYLLYLAWLMWRDRSALEFDSAASVGYWQTVGKAILINLLNPKLTLFFFAFLPLFIAEDDASPAAAMLTLSLVFMLITLLVFVLYGVLASSVSRFVASPRAVSWLRRSFAVAFAGLGIRLAFTSQ